MLIQPTLDSLNHLKLYGMAAALSEQLTQSTAQSLAFEDRLGLLVEREIVHRENRRLTRLLQLAQLKERAASRTSTSARAAASIAANSRASAVATGSAPARIFSSMAPPAAARPSSAAPCPSSLPPGPVRALSARAAAVR